jgi:Na+-driven multidrug efflux pump
MIAVHSAPVDFSAYVIVDSCCIFGAIINIGIVTGTTILLARNLASGRIKTSKFLIFICLSFAIIVITILVIFFPTFQKLSFTFIYKSG